MTHGNEPTQNDSNRRFATTQWSMVRAVGDGDSAVAKSALQELCQIYWYPLYAYVRHQGNQPETAADLTQAFFTDLLSRDDLKQVDPAHGKFRSFLIASIKHFLLNQWDKQRAQKRGGGKKILSIDFADADSRYRNEPAHENTSDRIFEKQWALTLLDRANLALQKEFEKRGKSHQFEKLRIFLAGKSPETTMAVIAGQLNMTEVAAKVAVHRMRQRFGEFLRAEIEKTVDQPGDIDSEIQHLFDVLKN